jgi:hypothetical protein
MKKIIVVEMEWWVISFVKKFVNKTNGRSSSLSLEEEPRPAYLVHLSEYFENEDAKALKWHLAVV